SRNHGPEGPDKWGIIDALTMARTRYGLSYRTVAVLRAILSFYPQGKLDSTSSLVVFASNRKLAEQAHGMPASTLRRQIARLVHVGLIARRSSTNGKRYIRRDSAGTIIEV